MTSQHATTQRPKVESKSVSQPTIQERIQGKRLEQEALQKQIDSLKFELQDNLREQVLNSIGLAEANRYLARYKELGYDGFTVSHNEDGGAHVYPYRQKSTHTQSNSTGNRSTNLTSTFNEIASEAQKSERDSKTSNGGKHQHMVKVLMDRGYSKNDASGEWEK